MNVQLSSPQRVPVALTWTLIGLCMLVCATTGCVEGRTSNHELEHQTPPHWPRGLTDAAEKIETRLNAITGAGSQSQQARAELTEIVSWLPEVAADTPLNEVDWNKIHAACGEIERVMAVTGDTTRYEPQLRTLIAQLRAWEPKVEESLSGTELEPTGVN